MREREREREREIERERERERVNLVGRLSVWKKNKEKNNSQ